MRPAGQGVTVPTAARAVRLVPMSRADASIARGSNDALHAAVVVPDTVEARVLRHVVDLLGVVAWSYQRDAAVHAVTGVAGVTSVVDRIRIEPAATYAATQIGYRLRAAFANSHLSGARDVRVVCHGSEVTLTGLVPTLPSVTLAGRVAWSAPGVTRVHNQLRVPG